MSQISRLKDAEISNGNLINADDIDAEFNQLLAESNSQDTRLTNIESNAVTLTGVKTFSSNPKMNGIDERTAASGVAIDSVRCKDGMVKISGTPTEGGEIGYASNRLKYHNGTSVITLPDYGFISTVESRSSNTILAVADLGKVLVCTSTFTQTLTAAATLTSGWFAHIRNDGTGIITIDPNASETIDGSTTIALYPGEAFSIVCDGSNFKTIGRQKGRIFIQQQTASNSTAIDFTAGFGDSEFEKFDFELKDMVAATAGSTPWIRVSEDSGSNFKSGASDYLYAGNGSYSNATTAVLGNGTDAQLVISRDTVKNSAIFAWGAQVEVLAPAISGTNKTIRFRTSAVRNSDSLFVDTVGAGQYVGSTNAINGFRFLMSSGNITSGTLTMWGHRK